MIPSHSPRSNSVTATATNAAAVTALSARPGHTPNRISPMPATSAHRSSAATPAQAGAGFMKRPDSTLSSMLAWICMPGILPSANGTVMRS